MTRDARPQMVWTALGPVEVALAGDGPAVLVVHGQPGGYDQALSLSTALGPDHHVIAPSRPGYLGTPISNGHTVDAQADLLAALLDVLGHTDVAVLALSAGAPVALRLAERHPHRVRAVALVAPVTGPDTHPITLRDRLMMSRPALVAVNITLNVAPSVAVGGAFVEAGFPSVGSLIRESRRIAREPHLVDRLRTTIRTALPYRHRRDGTEADDRIIARLTPDLGSGVAVPVLAIHGDADTEVRPSHSLGLVGRVPLARVMILGGAGHVVDLHPLWHQAEAAIRAFIAQAPSRAPADPASPADPTPGA